MIDFVIPSIGRPTLNRTLKSIQEQQFMFAKDKNWNVFVGFDGISATNIEYDNLIQDDKFNFIFFEEKLGKIGEYGIGNAGIVRNEIIKKVNSSNKWIAFVDDDDTVTSYYVDSLAVELENTDPPFDVCVFRMRCDPGGERILPPIMNDELGEDKVGISFCVKKDFIKKHNIKFVNDIREDFKFLMDLKNAGAVIKVSKYVTYNVGF